MIAIDVLNLNDRVRVSVDSVTRQSYVEVRFVETELRIATHMDEIRLNLDNARRWERSSVCK